MIQVTGDIPSLLAYYELGDTAFTYIPFPYPDDKYSDFTRTMAYSGIMKKRPFKEQYLYHTVGGKYLFTFTLNKSKEMNNINYIYNKPKEFKLQKTVKNIKYDSWYKWSQSVIDSAKFLASFKDINDFKNFVDLFQYNIQTKTALPLLISTKLFGFRFPLACDFLKEIGYTDYPKPDVHIKDIVRVLLKIDSGVEISDISAYEIIIDIATKSNVTPYKMDKILSCMYMMKMKSEEMGKSLKRKDFVKLGESIEFYPGILDWFERINEYGKRFRSSGYIFDFSLSVHYNDTMSTHKKIDEQTLDNLLYLSRLSPESTNLSILKKQVDDIVGYFEILSKYDDSKNPYDAYPSTQAENLREDEIVQGLEIHDVKKVSKDFMDGYFQVPKVLGEGV